MFYNARWPRSVPLGIDPALGRFAQADTIVPAGVQGYDRFAYVNNNPMRYTDPTGHMCSDPENTKHGFCEGSANVKTKIGNKVVSGNGIQRGGGLTLEELITKEIDRRFDPYRGWLPSTVEYESSIFPTLDYEAELAYEQAGYDIVQIASNNQDNPMKEDDWVNSGFDYEYIYSKGVRGQPSAYKYFLKYMGRSIDNPSNYEANYLNALMATHPRKVEKAKEQYYKELLSTNGSKQAAWEWLQMTIDVAGPDP